MKILAIETSCDETAAAVVEDGRCIISSVVHSQIDDHKIYGGVVPEIASRMHVESIVPITQAALEQANLEISDVDAIGVTTAPGLIGALLVGVNFAKGLALAAQKPLIPVHHIRGHVAANYLAYPHLSPPFLCLIVSGGHSHIVEVKEYTQYKVVGRTRDDAAGEAFDKVARVIGLGYPGGALVEQAARNGDPTYYKLPRPKVDTPYDFSFSGLKTAVVNLVHNKSQKGETLVTEHLAASFQQTVCDILCQRFFAAADALGYKSLACAGGVSANSQLRNQLSQMAGERHADLFMPPLSLCGDNAAMIGAQAFFEYQEGYLADLSLNAMATSPIEDAFCKKHQ